MPGPIRYYKRDPQKGKKRGAGHYYHRGHAVYSKKDDKRDRMYRAKGFRGLPRKIGSGVYRHTHDVTGKKARQMGLKRPRIPRTPKIPRKNPRRRTCAVRGCNVHPIKNRKYCSKHRKR